ncbi:MAG: hypothetical protein L6R28_16555 [Planctomycetes bacterium]|nr:hypothetical protein [Planctomycetota bacterium]
MPRGRKRRGRKAGKAAAGGKSKRGRKPIFTPEQKRVLDRMIREALREQLRSIVRGL